MEATILGLVGASLMEDTPGPGDWIEPVVFILLIVIAIAILILWWREQSNFT